MKKKLISVAAAVLFAAVSAFGIEPAVGGENLFDIASPFGLSYGSSVTGGGVRFVNPASIILNPAITAKEQRVSLNVGYTALVSQGEKESFGSVFQTGITIPYKWSVFTGYLNGTFPNTDYMGIGNSMNVKAALSKEITEHLDVGAGLNAGFAWGRGSDWGVSANLGFVYTMPQLAFMKDFRYGVSINNLGKNYNTTPDSEFLECYPGFALIKAGASGILFSNDNFKIGASLDLSTPCFTNMIVDAGFQFVVKNMLTVSVAEKLNVQEMVRGHASPIPSIGIFFNFKFNVKDNEYLASHDWSQSEMTAATAYRNLYSNIHAISAELDVAMGLKDETPPVIVIWNGEEEE